MRFDAAICEAELVVILTVLRAGPAMQCCRTVIDYSLLFSASLGNHFPTIMLKKGAMEKLPQSNIVEYQWPSSKEGGFFILKDHVAAFLDSPSLEMKLGKHYVLK